MELDRQSNHPERPGFSLPARIVIGALCVFAAITMVQWVVASVLGLVKVGLVFVVIAGVAVWVVTAKGSR